MAGHQGPVGSTSNVRNDYDQIPHSVRNDFDTDPSVLIG